MDITVKLNADIAGMGKIKAYMNWSGGKDSALCLHKIREEGRYDVSCLLTSVNKAYDRISMHGVRTELLRLQADALDIPLRCVELPEQPGMDEYERAMEKALKGITAEGVHHALFGDIYLADLRKYREEKMQPLGIEAHFPLWETPTAGLVEDFIRLGFKAIVVCVNEQFLDRSFCGRMIDRSFVNDLPGNVDPCGENGEYHSFVFDGPVFKKSVPFQKGGIVHREYAKPSSSDDCYKPDSGGENYGFYFCDLLPVDE